MYKMETKYKLQDYMHTIIKFSKMQQMVILGRTIIRMIRGIKK